LVPGNTVNDIVNITAMAVFEAQRKACGKYEKYSMKKLKEKDIVN
jgi:hypothetical protein